MIVRRQPTFRLYIKWTEKFHANFFIHITTLKQMYRLCGYVAKYILPITQKPFVFPFAIKKSKVYNTQKYNISVLM